MNYVIKKKFWQGGVTAAQSMNSKNGVDLVAVLQEQKEGKRKL